LFFISALVPLLIAALIYALKKGCQFQLWEKADGGLHIKWKSPE